MRNPGLRKALKVVLGTSLIACVPVLLWQCSGKSVDPDKDIARELTKVEAQLVASDNSFGIKLFKAIAEGEPDS